MENRSMELYGTPVFDPKTMRGLIGFGHAFYNHAGVFLGFVPSDDQKTLDFSPWLEAMPEQYRTNALRVIDSMKSRWFGMRVCDATLDVIVHEFLSAWETIFERIEEMMKASQSQGAPTRNRPQSMQE